MDKRLGYKKQNKLSVAKVGGVVRELRKLSQSEDTAHRAPPAAHGGANPKVQATLMVDGAKLKIPLYWAI